MPYRPPIERAKALRSRQVWARPWLIGTRPYSLFFFAVFLALALLDRRAEDVAEAGTAIRGAELSHRLLLVGDFKGLDRQGKAAVVTVDEPSGDLYYGSDVAAPLFADVMTESLRLLAIAPDALPARDSGVIVQAMSQ